MAYDYLPIKITSNFRGDQVANLKQYRGRVRDGIKDLVDRHAQKSEHALKAEAQKYWRTGRTTRTARAILSSDGFAFQLGWRQSEFTSIKTRTGKTPAFYVFWFLYGSRNHTGNDFHGRVTRQRSGLFKREIDRLIQRNRRR